jgi:hypothetical protein
MAETIPIHREVNLNIARVAASFATPGLFEFLCECGAPSCQQYVAMTLESFSTAQRPVVAPGHFAA